MAYEIDTATGHYDLFDRIRTFVESTIPIAQRYTVLRSVAGTDREVIWKAPGLSGTEEIFMGIKAYQSIASDYYNLKWRVFTGYVPGNSFETQPGSCPVMALPLWNQSTPYWLVANGQRICVFAKVENVYEPAYIGKYLTYTTPAQYPYPVFCGASLSTDSATRYSDVNHDAFFKGSIANCRLRFVDGVWKQPDASPYNRTHQLRNTITSSETATGYYGLHAIVLSDSTPNVYGELDGLYYISGYNNAVENVATVSGTPYVVMRNIWRTGFNDYIALELS